MEHKFFKWLLNQRLIANKTKKRNKRKQKSHKYVIFAFICLISAQFVMIMSVFSQLKLVYFK